MPRACTSGTGGTASFQERTCSGDHAVKEQSFCFILPPKLHRSDKDSGPDGTFVEIDKNNVINVRLDDLGGDVSGLSNADLLNRFSTGLDKDRRQ